MLDNLKMQLLGGSNMDKCNIEDIKKVLEEYKNNKKTLKELQEEFDYLDYLNIETSIYFGDEIESGIYEEIEMEIWRENDFYIKIDNSFNIIDGDYGE